MTRDPWICPACGAGVAPGVDRCDHGGDALGQSAVVRGPVPTSSSGAVTVQIHTAIVGAPRELAQAIASGVAFENARMVKFTAGWVVAAS